MVFAYGDRIAYPIPGNTMSLSNLFFLIEMFTSAFSIRSFIKNKKRISYFT